MVKGRTREEERKRPSVIEAGGGGAGAGRDDEQLAGEEEEGKQRREEGEMEEEGRGGTESLAKYEDAERCRIKEGRMTGATRGWADGGRAEAGR